MSNPHGLLTHPYSLSTPHRLTGIPSWHEHIPFAFALVAAARPRLLVELGTFRGDSYCAFCQAVDGLAVATACYAVDDWQGDDHAGRYGEEVFEELSRYHDPRYGRFSRLVRSTFDQARTQFAEGSIDLLHIDGLHTYEAVAHDFEAWRSRLSDRAIVLFHDINVREREFGVWRLWEELSVRHPSFAFQHGHGLGVLVVGDRAPAEVLELCALPAEGREVVRSRFAALGSRIGLMTQLEVVAGRLGEAEARVAASVEALGQRDRRIQDLEREAAAGALAREQVGSAEARQAAALQLVERREQRILHLEKEATSIASDLARRVNQVGQLETSAAELRLLLLHAEDGSRLLTEQVEERGATLGALREELTQLRAPGRFAPEKSRGLVGWFRKNNRIRLARRKARRGELLYGRDPLLSLPAATAVVGQGPIAWLRRWNRARLAQRKGPVQGLAGGAPQPAPHTGRSDVVAPVDLALPAAAAAAAAAAPPRALAPASASEAWDAYPRLKAEFREQRHARQAALQPSPPALVVAPSDLEAFACSLDLPAVLVPAISIVIPVRDGLRATLECLAAIALHTPSRDYEVMVIDDGSTDGTAAVLRQVKRLRYFRNESRVGLLLSANRCAAMSRGEFLVFLTGSVQVTPGWLPPLIDAQRLHERVGAAVPKVLDSAGRLLSAGAIVNPDLTVTSVGQGDDPGRPRYNYAREVHCGTGACLVLLRRHFDEVGGFSRELEPSPAADCDLQLKLKGLGLRPIYRPESVVVARGGATGEGPPDPAGPGPAGPGPTGPGAESPGPTRLARQAQWMRERWGDAVDAMNAVRLIAFYLPQFHPFQENEFWWGKGFTEWTNVTKAQPCFAGHEQPHLPTDMGFYDLRVPEVMIDQARLARAYGVSGFCYYYYWFQGKRLLETPVERLLEQPAAALPFCLCWANENWTRRWDGGDGASEILMGQAHSDEDDEAVILDLIRFLRHPSYIRVDGKPMLLVYRVALFPDIRRTAALWRATCRREGLGEIHLVRADTFEDARRCTPPRDQGFDAAVEFPPHTAQAPVPPPAPPLRPGFSGAVYDYQAEALHAASFGEAAYLRYRTVVPRWDNTPRRQDSATIFTGSSPGAYRAYLEELLRYTREQSVGEERVTFVNAWNEWAEGAHLEADRRYGRAFLEATLAATEAHLQARGA
jgi:GT2 family glycosyltransferase